MINYAHRGASEYAPENTLSSFYLGLLQGANGIETDVRRTKDGCLVLFHDDTLNRVSDGEGRVSDCTLEELKTLEIRGNATCGFYDRILTLREFLEKFSKYKISFAIELKGAGVEEDTLSMIEEFGILERTTFTSFQFAYIKKIKELNPKARVGWLTFEINDENINALLDIGAEEIAPNAENINEGLVEKCRRKKLGVRAWGVSDVSVMKRMCELSVDGMTVNFPDKLFCYLNHPD
ncbi:MAG: hypothetical protein IKU65_01940 [Oscillospiraceae bacterium]|nr:hypothetical protein [Oscillospiraceae bacterium]